MNLNSAHPHSQRTRSGSIALLCSLVVVLAMLSQLTQADEPPGEEDDGSDPTVGTLPMVGDTDGEFLDQTITLRGTPSDLRRAVVSVGAVVGGEAAAVESIDLGNGRSWIRYYGDVQLELDLGVLSNIDVEVFTGFEGGGLSYTVGQAGGFGSVRRVPTGSVIRLDPVGLTNSGLLSESLFVAGVHQTGARTMTSLDLMPVDGTIVIRQDV